jgi:hypothetical protein
VYRNSHPVARHVEQLESNVRIPRQSSEAHTLACGVRLLVMRVTACPWSIHSGSWREGGLTSYGVDLGKTFPRAAEYVPACNRAFKKEST